MEFKAAFNKLKEINGNEEKLQKERKTIQDFEKKYKILKEKLRILKENTNEEDSNDLDKIESILKEAEEQILPQINMMKGKIQEINSTEENKNE